VLRDHDRILKSQDSGAKVSYSSNIFQSLTQHILLLKLARLKNVNSFFTQKKLIRNQEKQELDQHPFRQLK
jgi:hypothetical protein